MATLLGLVWSVVTYNSMNKHTRFSMKGFTLIELLVVVAIVGIIAAIVVASVTVARTRAAESAIKANLRSLASEAELVYDSAGTYAAINNCHEAGNQFNSFIVAIEQSGATTTCTGDGADWVVSATRQGKSWSIDSSSILAEGGAEEEEGGGGTTWASSNHPGGQMNWNAAVAACAGAGGSLPSLQDYQTFFGATSNPLFASPDAFFLNTVAGPYWTSTEIDGGNAWGIFLDSGAGIVIVGETSKASLGFVRCFE